MISTNDPHIADQHNSNLSANNLVHVEHQQIQFGWSRTQTTQVMRPVSPIAPDESH